jgi:steroid delta-isomerase-like uncharacterized protein
MPTQQEERNAAVAKRAFGGYFSEVGPEKYAEQYSKNTVIYEYGLPGSPTMKSREELLVFLRQMSSSFPGATYEPELILPSGNFVTVVWRWRAALKQDFMGVKATGQKIDLPGVMIWEFDQSGLVKSERVWWNFLEFLTQLGVAPPGMPAPPAS